MSHYYIQFVRKVRKVTLIPIEAETEEQAMEMAEKHVESVREKEEFESHKLTIVGKTLD